MSESVLAQIAALKAKSTPELRALWQELFDRDPPPLGGRYLEDRVAFRLQELQLGALSDRSRRKLDALVDQLDPKAARRREPKRLLPGPSFGVNGRIPSTWSLCVSTISNTRAVRTNHYLPLREQSRTSDGTDHCSSASAQAARTDEHALS